MRMLRTLIISLVILFFCSCVATEQGIVHRKDQNSDGPEIGQYMPNFTVKDVMGNEISLKQFESKKNVLLIAYFSHK